MTIQTSPAVMPKSPTNMWINLTGMLISLASIWWLREFGQDFSTTVKIIVVCVSLALPIVVLELLLLKTFRNASTGLDFSNPKPINAKRTAIKLLGFYASLGFVAAIYWLFPEYNRNIGKPNTFYYNYFDLMLSALPYLAVIAIPYFLLIDRSMKEPKDGYWHLGCCFVLRFSEVDFGKVWQLLLGWIVKLFFLPLMMIYLGGNLNTIINANFSYVFSNYMSFHGFIINFLFYIDLLFVTVGYMCTVRLFDSHIRSVEPSFLGWGVALMCYQPLWNMFSSNYLGYGAGPGWQFWYRGYEFMIVAWGLAIVLLTAIYVWSSIPFGIRFSNLTHRGILTNGPYRFTKHPAYVSKNLSWWLIAMPFMGMADHSDAIRLSILLIFLNGIYFMRARTEERHLSWDPDYVAYARHIEKHGIFACVGRWLPVLKFKPGHLFNIGDKHERYPETDEPSVLSHRLKF